MMYDNNYEHPERAIESAKIFPGTARIDFEYRWFNKFTGQEYDSLPAEACQQLGEYKPQRRTVLTAYTDWKDVPIIKEDN